MRSISAVCSVGCVSHAGAAGIPIRSCTVCCSQDFSGNCAGAGIKFLSLFIVLLLKLFDRRYSDRHHVIETGFLDVGIMPAFLADTVLVKGIGDIHCLLGAAFAAIELLIDIAPAFDLLDRAA